MTIPRPVLDALERAKHTGELRQALADLVAAAEKAFNKRDEADFYPDEFGYEVYSAPEIREAFEILYAAVERARKVMKEEA